MNRDILSDLNPRQREAVIHKEGPLLILAGAGTGKTRVITYRIAHLIQQGVSPFNILAVTFTNKAAEEMRKRVDNLAGGRGKSVWISTFHSLASQILRRELDGNKKNFVIYDENDQEDVVRECLKELDINDKIYRVPIILAAIEKAKEELIDEESYAIYGAVNTDPFRKKISAVYYYYQKKLKLNNALDFGDLLLRATEILRNKPDVLARWQERFRYIMVDEYQDTNHAQYILTKLLASRDKNICVVGDDDQSIYTFRGADIKNILDFEKDYPNLKVVKLERNYRSTQEILDRAYMVIKNNVNRKEKRLWTDMGQGKPIFCAELFNERDEGRWVVRQIQSLQEVDYDWRDMAIFYRTNAQSRILEDSLREWNIPYNIVGNVGFYERKEIKDIIAYIKVILNPQDSLSLKRIINIPQRGIGKTTLGHIEKYARKKDTYLFDTLNKVDNISSLRRGVCESLRNLHNMFVDLSHRKDSMNPSEFVKLIVERIGYIGDLEREDTAEARSKVENVWELVSAIKSYEEEVEGADIRSYLEKVSLMTGIDNWQEEKGKVTLMTLHLAKGLEFPVVFITGLEEGLFPHSDSLNDESELEEERRLCYVGMTRAKDRLFITSASQRRIYGQVRWNVPSRFIEESGLNLEEIEPPTGEADGEWQIGSRVRHEDLGEGEILHRSGRGDDTKVLVLFDNGEWRKFLVKYVNLERV